MSDNNEFYDGQLETARNLVASLKLKLKLKEKDDIMSNLIKLAILAGIVASGVSEQNFRKAAANVGITDAEVVSLHAEIKANPGLNQEVLEFAKTFAEQLNNGESPLDVLKKLGTGEYKLKEVASPDANASDDAEIQELLEKLSAQSGATPEAILQDMTTNARLTDLPVGCEGVITLGEDETSVDFKVIDKAENFVIVDIIFDESDRQLTSNDRAIAIHNDDEYTITPHSNV